ncbi:unnamed protein product [Leuciscus chuanchicus]
MRNPQTVNEHVDTAGSKEQCAQAGAEEPVPEDQEGATGQHQRWRESPDARTPLWHRRTQILTDGGMSDVHEEASDSVSS